MTREHLRRVRLCFCAAAVIVSASSADAATKTWSTTPSNGSWSNGANWVGGIAPVAGDALVFPASSSILSTTNDLANGIAIASLTFDGTGYSLSGNAITLGGGLTCTTGAAPQINHIGLSIILAATATVDPVAGCEVSVDGSVSGASGLVKNGVGNLRLTGASSFAGTVVVNNGIVIVDNDQGLGAADGTSLAGTIVNAGASVIASTGAVGNEYLSLSGTGFGGLAGALYIDGGSVGWAGPLVLSADSTIFVPVGILTLSGPVTGPGALTVLGDGRLVLAGSASYSGATVVQGRLVLNGTLSGTPSVTVKGASMLGGTGTITSPLTTLSGCGLAPGQSPGILTVGDTTLEGNTNFTVELNGPIVGSQYDQLNVVGTIDVTGANLNLFPGFLPAPGTQFVVVNNDGGDPIIGTFAGAPEGGVVVWNGVSFRVSYVGGTGNDVVVTAVTAGVPTMDTWMLMALTAVLAAVSLRRLRRAAV